MLAALPPEIADCDDVIRAPGVGSELEARFDCLEGGLDKLAGSAGTGGASYAVRTVISGALCELCGRFGEGERNVLSVIDPELFCL